mgnify:CR=1 FL=1
MGLYGRHGWVYGRVVGFLKRRERSGRRGNRVAMGEERKGKERDLTGST